MCSYIHFLTKYTWKRYGLPYPTPSYGLNSTTTVLLQGWRWHLITHEGWYTIKQRNQSIGIIFSFIIYTFKFEIIFIPTLHMYIHTYIYIYIYIYIHPLWRDQIHTTKKGDPRYDIKLHLVDTHTHTLSHTHTHTHTHTHIYIYIYIYIYHYKVYIKGKVEQSRESSWHDG